MTISYEQAMTTLKSMFAGADTAVLHAVLEQNGGHMERTIDMLLQMNIPMVAPADQQPAAPNPAPASPRATPGPTPPTGPPPPTAKRAPRAKQANDWSQGLPDDFLRPPSYFKSQAGGDKIDEDAQLAQMLQDQLFMEDLMRNPEYYFGQGAARPHRRHHQPQPQPQPVMYPAQQVPHPDAAAAPNVGPGPSPVNDVQDVGPSAQSATFKEKFAKLGEAAKERLRKIASAFSRKKNGGADPDYMSLPSLDDVSKPEDVQLGINDAPPEIELQDRRKNKAKTHEFGDEL